MPADEFDVIARYFAPLARGAEARGLVDDAALLQTQGALVITADALVEGVHFFPHDPIDAVAQKALRVNLSDLAAKGAAPVAAMLCLIWPDRRPSAQIEAFARGLGEDLQRYDLKLLGGDTTSTPGPLSIAITAFGAPHEGASPARSGARIGDDLWVTGEIGDAYIGLQHLKRDAQAPMLGPVRRYRLPEPRVRFAPFVARYASASIDVSDGLAQDADKIAWASNVAMWLNSRDVPLSQDARAWIASGGDPGLLMSGGDDYEILFTAAREHRAEIEEAGRETDLRVTRIGRVESGRGALVIGYDGSPAPPRGFRHKLGA